MRTGAGLSMRQWGHVPVRTRSQPLRGSVHLAGRGGPAAGLWPRGCRAFAARGGGRRTALLAKGDGGRPGRPLEMDQSRPAVLVAHSNAGLFLPVIAADLGRPVAGLVFADASVPPVRGSAPVAEGDFLPFL